MQTLPSETHTKRQYRWLVVLILLGAFALRVFDLERMPPFAHGDGVNLAEHSLKVARGEAPWYGVRRDGDPNWAFAQYAPYALWGDNLWALRVMSALWSVLVLAGVFYSVREMFGVRVALIATLLSALGHLLIHFGRIATIVLPSVLTSFLSVALFLRAQRSQGTVRRALLFALAGALLAVNLYEYVAARAVLFAITALWLFSLPRSRTAWRAWARDSAMLAVGFALVATPILVWYGQHPADLTERFGVLSVFHPRNAAINQRLYGPVDTATLLLRQTQRSLGGFFMVADTSPDYHFESPLLDPATAVLVLPGLVIAWRRKPRLTLAMLVWLAVGLVAGAILVVEPPTSYHYFVLVPLAMVFAALCLDWMASSRFGWRFVPLVLVGIGITNSYLYFEVYPYKGAWYSLESSVGLFVRERRACCSFWYLGEPDPMPRKISALICAPTAIHYVRDVEQIKSAMHDYLADAQPDVIIVPNEKVNEYLPRLRRHFPRAKEQIHRDRGRVMFRSYTLAGVDSTAQSLRQLRLLQD